MRWIYARSTCFVSPLHVTYETRVRQTVLSEKGKTNAQAQQRLRKIRKERIRRAEKNHIIPNRYCSIWCGEVDCDPYTGITKFPPKFSKPPTLKSQQIQQDCCC